MPDDRKEIEVDLTDEEFLRIAKLAHEKDITFNQMVEKILEYAIKERKESPRSSTG